jgi:hypothetical protein
LLHKGFIVRFQSNHRPITKQLTTLNDRPQFSRASCAAPDLLQLASLKPRRKE